MDSLTIRVSRSAHNLLRELSEESGEAMTVIVDRALKDYRRARFWADYDAAYSAIRADPQASTDLNNEVSAWDSTLANGLEVPPDEPSR